MSNAFVASSVHNAVVAQRDKLQDEVETLTREKEALLDALASSLSVIENALDENDAKRAGKEHVDSLVNKIFTAALKVPTLGIPRPRMIVADEYVDAYREMLGQIFDIVPMSETMKQPEPDEESLMRFGYAPGNYTKTCISCRHEFIAYKRAWRCKGCATKLVEGRDY